MAIVALVKAAWVVENLQLVGGGCLFHLAYNLNQISSAAREWLSQGDAILNSPINIYWLQDAGKAVLVADGHLAELICIDSTIRLHIRLLHVRPYIARKEIFWPHTHIGLDLH